MAIKFVNEADLTTVGNAIRAKTGGSELLVFPTGMAEAIAGIETGVDTSDATATANDMALDKTAYVKGAKVTGSVPVVNTSTVHKQTIVAASALKAEGVQLVAQTTMSERLFRGNSIFKIGIPRGFLGNAEAADVAAGKTFTSSAGLKVTGTGAMAEIMTATQVMSITVDEVIQGYADRTGTYTCPAGYMPFNLSTNCATATLAMTDYNYSMHKLTYTMVWYGSATEDVEVTISLIKCDVFSY